MGQLIFQYPYLKQCWPGDRGSVGISHRGCIVGTSHRGSAMDTNIVGASHRSGVGVHFGLNINELPSCIARGIFRALFVDDLAICFRGHSLDTIERHLQKAVNATQEWATRNGFKFADQKCKVIHFTAPQFRVHRQSGLETHFYQGNQRRSSGCGGISAFHLRSTSVC